MSCFGGCGYYRRRRLAALQQSAEIQPSRCHVTHERCANTRQSYYAYTGPGADPVPDVLHLPPPYTEVCLLLLSPSVCQDKYHYLSLVHE